MEECLECKMEPSIWSNISVQARDRGEYLGHGRWSCFGNMRGTGYFSVDDKMKAV